MPEPSKAALVTAPRPKALSPPPGVKAADSYDPTKNRMAILSVNGQGGRNVNVTVNGVDNKDNTVGGPVMHLSEHRRTRAGRRRSRRPLRACSET